jgi:hypothetical protein
MTHYYYPLSTRDFAFENLFSSESVSPAVYYPQKAFGFDYFPVLPGVNSEQAIILFSQPPVYSGDNNAKFILKIAEAAINHDELVFVAEGMFAYYGTIYFEKKDLSILFFSAKDIRIAMLKSNMSLPTKTAEKYSSAFQIINETDCQAIPFFDASFIQHDKDLLLKVAIDKKYNHFKGFIYGLIIGQIANDRKREFGLKVLFQEITNAFAELKSRLDDQISSKYKSDAARLPRPYIEKLFKAVEVAEFEYRHLTFGSNIDEQTLIKYILSKVSRLKSHDDVVRYLDYVITTDELLGIADYQRIVDGYVKESSASSIAFQELRSYIEQFIEIFQSERKPRQSADELNNRIKVLLRNISEGHLEELAALSYDLTTDLSGISYDFNTNEVMLNTGQIYLNTKADNEFTFIINAILKFAKSNKGPAQKEMILRIVEEIGNIYSKRGKNTLLYQYLENRIDVYSLDNASNLVMKNFVAFVFNPDSLEKLDNFLISKSVEERWMAFSFWGAYNGFANISRNYTRDIFSANNIKLQNYIDDYLKNYLSIVVNKKATIINLEKPYQEPIIEPKPADNIEPESVVKFFNLHVAKQYKLNLDEFTRALILTNQKGFQDELKLKHQIPKKDSLKLFTAIKKYFDPGALFH